MNLLRDPSFYVSAPFHPVAAKAVASQILGTRDTISKADTRVPAKRFDDDQRWPKIIFTALTGILAALAAIFATVLELSVFWRNLWLATCIAFAVLMFVGIVLMSLRLTQSST
jgi:hypothetical protein